jgi:hypothetical protein
LAPNPTIPLQSSPVTRKNYGGNYDDENKYGRVKREGTNNYDEKKKQSNPTTCYKLP